jgi:hypothetical protein
VIPDDSRISVFSSGTWKGLRGMVPIGGHTPPISKLGASLLWKKVQKKEKKKRTSEAIKSSIPIRRPATTFFE